MARLYITEFAEMPQLNSAGVIPQCPVAPGIAEQSVAIGGGSVASAAFNQGTKFVMLNSDAVCSLAWSSDGTPATAVATAQRMSANETRFYGVHPGGKVSVIANT